MTRPYRAHQIATGDTARSAAAATDTILFEKSARDASDMTGTAAMRMMTFGSRTANELSPIQRSDRMITNGSGD